jgi:hypothetical protein
MDIPILEKKEEVVDKSKPRVTVVEETNIGLYVWMLPNGEPLADEDANLLAIPSKRGDKRRMKMLADAAAHHGYPDGEPYFYAGSRRVSDEEFWEQIERIQNGEVPDPYDIPAIMGEIEAKQSALGY